MATAIAVISRIPLVIRAALALGKKYKVSMPIITEVNKVLFGGKDVACGVRDLMCRDKKAE